MQFCNSLRTESSILDSYINSGNTANLSAADSSKAFHRVYT